MIDSAVFELAEVTRDRERDGKPYREFLRVPAMSAGLYELPAEGVDYQSPHATDEIYHVLEGRATFIAGEEARPVQAGSVIYVRAGVEHRFERIESALRILVVFAPAEA